MRPDATLSELQEFLAGVIRRSENLGAPANADVHDALLGLVAGSARLTPLEQADIYREQFWLRHRDSLDEDFPAFAYFLGRDAFRAFARAYLTAVPPTSFTLRDLGLALPAFADHYDFPHAKAAFARELAHFDLGFITTFDAAAREPVASEKVSAIGADAWPDARLELAPGLALFAFEHAVHTYRSAVRRGEAPSAATIEARPTRLALYRGDDLRVHQLEMAPSEYELLVALRDGASLSAACERANALEPEGVEASVGGWFATWARRGFVCDVVTGT